MLLQGCLAIWPAYSRIEPKTEFTIVDENQAPIADAIVILNRRPDGIYNKAEYDVRNELTDESGQVSFEGKRHWEIQVLSLHTPIGYDWSWCVAKPGYQTHYIQKDARTLTGKCDRRTDCPGEAVTITLEPGTSTPCDEPSMIADRNKAFAKKKNVSD